MEHSDSLEGYQRAALLKLVHHQSPVATIGRQGLTGPVRAHIDRELSKHELIKMRFVDHKESTRELTEQIGRELDAVVVATIGFTAILYRRNPDPEQRKVKLPVRSA